MAPATLGLAPPFRAPWEASLAQQPFGALFERHVATEKELLAALGEIAAVGETAVYPLDVGTVTLRTAARIALVRPIELSAPLDLDDGHSGLELVGYGWSPLSIRPGLGAAVRATGTQALALRGVHVFATGSDAPDTGLSIDDALVWLEGCVLVGTAGPLLSHGSTVSEVFAANCNLIGDIPALRISDSRFSSCRIDDLIVTSGFRSSFHGCDIGDVTISAGGDHAFSGNHISGTVTAGAALNACAFVGNSGGGNYAAVAAPSIAANNV